MSWTRTPDPSGAWTDTPEPAPTAGHAAIFDSAIFDPDIFDCAETLAVGIWTNGAPLAPHWANADQPDGSWTPQPSPSGYWS